MAAPVVSVIMPAYNVERYVNDAIESILNQTFKDFEFIIVDDASTDKTLAEIKKHSDERIKILVNETNSGPGACMNKAMRISLGKYIVRMDADDISHHSRIEKLHEFLESNPSIDVCGCSMQLFGTEKNSVEFSADHDEIVAGLFWKSTVPQGAVMMRKAIIERNNLFYDESFRVGGDWKYWCSIKDHVRFSNLKEVLYFYRRGEQNITVQHKNKSSDRSLKIHSYLLSDFGIPFNTDDLKKHQFVLGMFFDPFVPDDVRSARDWIMKLRNHNLLSKKYNHEYFVKISEQHWNWVFYKLVPYGFSFYWEYVSVSGFRLSNFVYYLKYTFNKMFGNK